MITYTDGWIRTFLFGLLPSFLLGFQGCFSWLLLCFVGWLVSDYSYNKKIKTGRK